GADGLTATPTTAVQAAEPTTTPTIELPEDIPTTANEAVTPTPIVFDGSDPEVRTETAVPDTAPSDVPTESPAPDVAVGEAPTETPPLSDDSLYAIPTETPLADENAANGIPAETPIVFEGGVPSEATETPIDANTALETATETVAPTDGSIYDVPTETPAMPEGGESVKATEGVAVTEIPVATEVPPAEEIPAEEPTPTPLSIVTVGDSEQSATASIVADFDPDTSWSVWPSLSPREVRLTLDLGQTQPVAALDLDLDDRGLLPTTEVWLSEDGVTWWNVTGFDARTSQPGEPVRVLVGYWTRYIALVVPYADTLGMAEVGGIQEIQVWAPAEGDPAPVRSLSEAGMPTTPEPVPTEVVPTEVATQEPVTVDGPVETAAPEEAVPAETPADSGDEGDPEVIAPEG
ncbi:MAG: hypothetical protein ACTHMX_02560, partial [Thermomicrobiales bacterium]